MFAWHPPRLIHSDSFLFLLHVECNRNCVPGWKTLFTNVAAACPAWSSGLFPLRYMAGNRSWLGLAHVLSPLLPEDSQVQSSWLLHSIHTLQPLSARPPAVRCLSCKCLWDTLGQSKAARHGWLKSCWLCLCSINFIYKKKQPLIHILV